MRPAYLIYEEKFDGRQDVAMVVPVPSETVPFFALRDNN